MTLNNHTVNPYDPPKGEITPPPGPPSPKRDAREHMARGIAAIGIVILVRMAWEHWKWEEAAIGMMCLAVGLGVLWRLRQRDKP